MTIPKEFRDALELSDSDMLSVELVDGKLEVVPVRVQPTPGGSPWLEELYDLFAPTRESLRGVPEDEINEAIDEAVKEVRSRKE